MRSSDNVARGIWIEPSGEGRALVVDGAVQSVSLKSPESVFGYWPLMLPEVRPRNALILGLGGGTLPQLLIRRFDRVAITGLDDNKTVIELATCEMGLDPEIMTIVHADAYEWVSQAAERFDYVAIDLYRGGEVPRRTFSTSFLRSVRTLLLPGARVVVNLVRDESTQERIDRLSRMFRIVQSRTAGKNLVVHAQLRRR